MKKYIKHKYGAKKVRIQDQTFDSKKEAKRYSELRVLERAKKISDLECQPKFVLQHSFTTNDGKTIRAITYIADFKYFDCEEQRFVVEDVKGYRTKEFNIKMKLFLFKYPHYKYLLT